MTIHFHCENCKHPIIAPEEMFGRRAICPQCKSTIHVPVPGAASVEEFTIVRDGWKVEDRQADSMLSDKLLPPDTGPALSTSVIDEVLISTGSQRGVPALAESNAPSSHSPDALWYVRPTSGGQFGPASIALLRQWKTEGRVTGDSWVWKQGWEDWQRATVVFSDLDAPAAEPVVDPKTRVATTKIASKTAYMKARRRRSALVTIGLSLGTIVVAALLLALFYVLRNQGGG